MLRLLVILVSVFAFSKVAFAADADMNKKPATEVVKPGAKPAEKSATGATEEDSMDDKTEENKAK